MITNTAILITFTIIEGLRDGYNYQIFGKPVNRYTDVARWLKVWHSLGAVLYFILTGYIMLHSGLIDAGMCLVSALLIRVALFDLSYNKGANRTLGYLGSEAKSDKLAVKYFGINGAVRKSLLFGIILVILNIIYYLLLN